MTIPTTTQELRQFLDQAVNSTIPITYTDRAGKVHQVFLTKVDETTVRTRSGRDEPVLSLMMIETVKETQEGEATGARAQEIFLLQCVDQTTPIEYEDRLNRKHRVFLTRMSLSKRRQKASPDEWVYALTMVDAWGGVFIYEMFDMSISVATTITLQPHVTAKYGTAVYGFAQYGN